MRIVPADGYYEWYKSQDPATKKAPKQPFYITPKDRSVLAMAGLYEFWRDEDAERVAHHLHDPHHVGAATTSATCTTARR